MFTDVHVSRGFTKIDFVTTGSLSGKVTVPRSTVVPILGMEMTIALPQEEVDKTNPFAIFSSMSVLDPAILFLLAMSRAAVMLELEHRTYQSLSREEPIEVYMGDTPMMTITPVPQGSEWGVKFVLHHGEKKGEGATEMDWPAQGWTWEQMLTNALSFPALSLVGAMGLAGEFEDRLRQTNAEFTISNPTFDPNRVEKFNTADTGGIEVIMHAAEGEPTVRPASAEQTESPPADQPANQEDELDRAYAALLREYGDKKGGLDA